MNFKNIILGIGIVVVYALLLWQGTRTFYPNPEFEDFCGESERFFRPFVEPIECETPQSVITDQFECNNKENYFHAEYDELGCLSGGFCDDCNKQFESAQEKHARNVFIVSIIIAVITFVVGFFVLSIEPVGSSLIGSSIWAVFYGTIVNWQYFNAAWQFVLLLIAFAGLIWFTVWLNVKARRIKESIKKTPKKYTKIKKKLSFWDKLRGKS